MMSLLFIALAFFVQGSLPGTLEVNENLILEKKDSFDIARIPGYDYLGRIGEPQLPSKTVFLNIRSDKEVESIVIESIVYEDIDGEYFIFPAQPPVILSVMGAEQVLPDFVTPREEVYESSNPYPSSPLEYVKTGSLFGHKVAEFVFYPVQYIPTHGRLRKVKKIQFGLRLRNAIERVEKKVSLSASRIRESLVKKIVLNPEDVPGVSRPKTDTSGFEYLIVTSEGLAPAFEELKQWKILKGIDAEIRTVSWITSHCSGHDNAEKIRNYLKVCYEDSGLIYVLLGGDVGEVPSRVAYAMSAEAGHPDEDNLHADLYYSDLDGTWDFDGDHIYGEVEDSVDLYPDVFVGRAPVNTVEQTQTFVNKTIGYEKSPPGDYENKVLFFAEILWLNPYTDAGVGKDMIRDLCLPQHTVLTRLYESLGNESRESVLNAMENGQNLLNHDGHGWIGYMGTGPDGLSNTDMDDLSNGNRMGVLYSIGCWVGAFDYDAISEHWITNPYGGGVAFIGNSRYGWGSPGNPGYGYSDIFDHTFYKLIFVDSLYRLGEVLGLDKALYVPYSRSANVYRWHQYQLNLLGDPELPIWTDIPKTFEVAYPESIPMCSTLVAITVRDGNGKAVEGALVCLHKDLEVYERGATALEGNVQLYPSPATGGAITVTVTKPEYRPHSDTIWVLSLEKYPVCVSSNIVDTLVGNGDSLVNPGERVELFVTIKNFGSQNISDLCLKLVPQDTLMQILRDTLSLGNLSSGGSIASGEAFVFEVDDSAQNAHILYTDLEFYDGISFLNSQRLAIAVALPRIEYVSYTCSDSVPEPGEEMWMVFEVANRGLGVGKQVEGKVFPLESYFNFPLGDTLYFGDILQGENSFDSLRIGVEGGSPSSAISPIEIGIWTEQEDTLRDTLFFIMGHSSTYENLDSGACSWSAESSWHVVDHRAYSGEYSLYCGREGIWEYTNGLDASLTSQPFAVIPGSRFSFNAFYMVPNYNVDGIYVEVQKNGLWKKIDFIGTGGALDSLLPIGNDWLPYEYDLSDYAVGETLQVRIRFVSDNDGVVDEGFYIDDLYIKGLPLETSVLEKPASLCRFSICPPSPTPARDRVELSFSLPSKGRLSIDLFDVSGRVIGRHLIEAKESGVHRWVWDTRDSQGRKVPSGVYIARVNFENGEKASRKIVIMR